MPKTDLFSTRAFATARLGFALANDGSAQYPVVSADGGRVWRIAGPQVHVDAADGAEGVGFVGVARSRTFFAYGSSVVDVTSDGGRTWWETFLGELVRAVVPGGAGDLVAFVQQSYSKSRANPAVTWQYVSRDGGRSWRYSDSLGGTTSFPSARHHASQLVQMPAPRSDRSVATHGSAARACRLDQLSIRLRHSFAEGGAAGAYLSFTNTSNSACRLRGWPRLTPIPFTGRATHPANRLPELSFPGYQSPRRVAIVILAPRQRADAAFQGSDGDTSNNKPCSPPYRKLRVGLPRGRQTTDVSAWIPYLGAYMPACSQIFVGPLAPSSALYHG